MKLPDKTTNIQDAISKIGDGASVMIGGFGVPGTPFCLIDELVRQGSRDLTIIKNDANEVGMGIDHLLRTGQVARLITTHIGLNARAIEMMNAGDIKVEFCAQGILAERIRAGGAGLAGILTDIGIDTELGTGKERVTLDGKVQMIEAALKADFALLHADRSDVFGNLSYVATAQNFNPAMAMAARVAIAEAEAVLPLGQVPPGAIHTPGPFVTHVVELTELTGEYAVVRR